MQKEEGATGEYDNISISENIKILSDKIKNLQDITDKNNAILQKILFRLNLSYVLNIVYWTLIIMIGLGAYLYLKDIVLYFFNNNPSMQNIFNMLEGMYGFLKTQ
jgi:hypothetical protein